MGPWCIVRCEPLHQRKVVGIRLWPIKCPRSPTKAAPLLVLPRHICLLSSNSLITTCRCTTCVGDKGCTTFCSSPNISVFVFYPWCVMTSNLAQVTQFYSSCFYYGHFLCNIGATCWVTRTNCWYISFSYVFLFLKKYIWWIQGYE